MVYCASFHGRYTLMTDEKDQIHHIRVSSKPETSHQEIFQILDVVKYEIRKRAGICENKEISGIEGDITTFIHYS